MYLFSTKFIQACQPFIHKILILHIEMQVSAYCWFLPLVNMTVMVTELLLKLPLNSHNPNTNLNIIGKKVDSYTILG